MSWGWARRPGVPLALATAVAFLLHLWVASAVEAPFVFHDEGSYVAVGRALLGGPPELIGPTYAPGYGVLLAPGLAFLDPSGVHLLGQVVNAAAAAALLPVLYVIARQLARLRPGPAIAVSVVASSSAALVVLPTLLLPEALLVLTTSASVVLLRRMLVAGTATSALLAGTTAAACYGLHTRGAAVVAAAALVTLWAAVSGGLRWRIAVLFGCSSAAVAAGAELLRRWAVQRLYPLTDTGKGADDLLALVEDPLAVARVGAGHVWYLVFATGGLAALGFVAAVHRGWHERRSADGMVAAHIVIGVLASLALSAVAHGGLVDGLVDRPDKLVYGRYLQQWAPVLVVASAWLLRRRSLRVASWTVAGAAAFSAAVAGLLRTAYDDSVWGGPVAWHNAPMLWLVETSGGRLLVPQAAVGLAVALLALLAVWMLVGVAGRRARAVGLALPFVLVLVVNVVIGHQVVRYWAAPASVQSDRAHQLGLLLEELGEPVTVSVTSPTPILYVHNLQFWHPDLDIDLSQGAAVGDNRLWITPLAEPPEAATALLAVEPDLALGLWVVDRAYERELRAGGTRFLDPAP